MDHSRNERTPFPNARRLPSKQVSLFLQSRMVVNVSLVPQHRKRLTNMENQMTVSLMGKEEGWPITFITSKVRYKRGLPYMGYIGLLFIQNTSPSLIGSNLPAIFHKQLALTIFGRCEQCIIDSMVYLSFSMVYLPEIEAA